MSENFYDVLQIDRTADDREIKKAYVKMLRKYPPEKAPEEFKKIREAYERLSNPVSRAEYDAYSQYKSKIDEHSRLGDEAFDREDYATAIREYKKILLIEPSLTFAKNRLGLALAYTGRYDDAAEQFTQLINLDGSNAVYYSNLAYVYSKMEQYEKAEEYCRKAYEMDTINDSTILQLANIYVSERKYDDAIEFLKSCLGKNSQDDFQDFIYYFELVKIYMYKGDNKSMEAICNKIIDITPEDNESKKYVSWKFGKFAAQLYQGKIYDLAEKLSTVAYRLNDDEDLKKLYEHTKFSSKIYGLFGVLDKDDRVLNVLKWQIYYYLYADDENRSEFDGVSQDNIKAIESYVKAEPLKVMNSIDIMRREYGELYNLKRDFYDEIYRLSEQREKAMGSTSHESSTSHSQSYERSSEESSNNGCGGVLAGVIIGAIIGSVIAPGGGTIIGIIIGAVITSKK